MDFTAKTLGRESATLALSTYILVNCSDGNANFRHRSNIIQAISEMNDLIIDLKKDIAELNASIKIIFWTLCALIAINVSVLTLVLKLIINQG